MSESDAHKNTPSKAQLLSPHIALGIACMVFLAFNFWCYHRNNYQKYRRKMEKLEQDSMTSTSRRVTSMSPNPQPIHIGLVNGSDVACDANLNPTSPTNYDVFQCDVPKSSNVENPQKREVLLSCDTDDYLDSSPPVFYPDKKSRGSNNYSDRSGRKREASMKMPLGLFASAAAKGKNNRLPAL